VEEVANQAGLTKKMSKEGVDAITSVISEALARAEKVALVAFVTFQIIKRKTTRGRDPRTGEEIQIPARKVPKSKAGKGLGEKVG